MNKTNLNTMILYYVHDPMCSWCWGFRPSWQTICAALDKHIEIKYLLGGLAADTKTAMPEAMQKDIAGYWRHIQQKIPGTPFNFDFWEKCKPRRATYPACRAVIAARKQNPAAQLMMIEAIQKAYYLNAQNPSDDDTLVLLAQSLNLDMQQFSIDLNAPATQQQLASDIHFARTIGAQGFPSLFLEIDGHYQQTPLDYNNPETTIQFIKRFI